MSRENIDNAMRAGMARGWLPADAALPSLESRPWPVVLLTALGAWLAAIPLFAFFGLLLGSFVMEHGGTYVAGVLLLAGAVVVLRAQVPIFFEQLAVPALLAGGALLAYGLFRDLPY